MRSLHFVLAIISLFLLKFLVLDNRKVFILLMVLLPFSLFSQVELVSLDATKTYPDDTQITYLQLSGYPIDADFLQFAEKEVLSNPLIQRFNLGNDGETCFYHSHKDITENMIVEEINNAYRKYFSKFKEKKEDLSVKSFKKSDYDGTFYKVGFKLKNTSNLDNIKKAVSLLKEQGNFEKINIVENIHFEISSYKRISADFVISIFDKFGLQIEDEFILNNH